MPKGAPAAAYSLWNAPGFGINPQANNPGVPVSAKGAGSQFSVGLMEFGTTDAGIGYEGCSMKFFHCHCQLCGAGIEPCPVKAGRREATLWAVYSPFFGGSSGS